MTDKSKFLMPLLAAGIGGGMWLGTWITLIFGPMSLFVTSYVVMLWGLYRIARARDKS